MSDPEGGYVVPWYVMQRIEEMARNPMPSAYFRSEPLPPLTLRQKARLKVMAWRSLIGYAIAGYTPTEDDY